MPPPSYEGGRNGNEFGLAEHDRSGQPVEVSVALVAHLHGSPSLPPTVECGILIE